VIRGTASRVLLIGWDAADWRVIHPLMDAGKLPALERLVNEGVMANLATLHPVLSPMLWASIATGKRPFKHGVLGFTEPTDDGQAIRPVTNLSRKTKAVWNILSQNNKTCNVVGWWPSHPAEPIRGVMVSDHYHRAVGPPDKPWPVRPGTIHPVRLVEPLAELRVNPNELTGEHLGPFIPRVAEIDQDKDRRVGACAKILAECTTVHAAATWLMEHEPWDFMAVYYDAIDHFCHGFMRYHPPRQRFVPETDFELYQGVVEAGYRYHDLMLHHLLKLAGDDTTVILISDHGFHPDHLRPAAIPREPAGPAVEHRDIGIFVMRGPQIRRDQIIHGANLLDIVPTVLTLCGIPVGADMDGKPLLDAFETPPELEVIPSWDTVPGDAGLHPPETRIDSFETQEALKQLVALGYIDQPDDRRETAIANTVNELRYNLARSLMDADRHAEAAPMLRELYERARNEYRFGIQLAMCYRALERIPELRALVEEMNGNRRREAEEARVRLKEMVAEFRQRRQQRLAERRAVAEAAPDAGEQSDSGEPSRPAGVKDEPAGTPAETKNERLLTKEEVAELRRLRPLAALNTYALDYLMGFVLAAEKDYNGALEYLARAEKMDATRPGLHIQIGETYLKLRCGREARRAFARAVEIDPDNPYAHLGLARSYLARRRNRRAVLEALTAIGLLYHYPLAHYVLGVALLRMGRYQRAVDALEVAVTLNPNFREAHRRLAALYHHRFGRPDKAVEHRRLADACETVVPSAAASVVGAEPQPEAAVGEHAPIEVPSPPQGDVAERFVARRRGHVDPAQTITVVTGLPRSGTSLMMKMLAAAGVPIVTDGVRAADEDNPDGYFEFEPVKKMGGDVAWLDEAQGKAVKIIHLLVPRLPRQRLYRVIVMHRQPDEVVASQRKMLARKQRAGGKLSDDELKRVLQRQMAALNGLLTHHPSFDKIDVNYNRLVSDPRPEVERLVAWLGGAMSVDDMVAAVNPSLYRQRHVP